jgi:hypothetical protein
MAIWLRRCVYRPPAVIPSFGDLMSHDIANPLATLELPEAAEKWLVDLWTLIHVIDDAHDGQKSNMAFEAVWAALVDMPSNPFFMAKGGALIPILATQILKWRAANEAEDDNQADEKTYMWRAGYYDVVAAVCHLCGMAEKAGAALRLYGETFAEYRGGFTCRVQ